ncbi:hypothetical protein PWG15_08750 [Ensifer adhaerens]|uniref:hypothetical protein n=1 Tax=Ensifer adhaerens TaxID=106592 RepID=UPI0023A9983E|nr:hypothetical protein [Ensifer adhaerens]WDZ78557.1 hypothetical protein PWG15_08750 [Ensifer adhaerens]
MMLTGGIGPSACAGISTPAWRRPNPEINHYPASDLQMNRRQSRSPIPFRCHETVMVFEQFARAARYRPFDLRS